MAFMMMEITSCRELAGFVFVDMLSLGHAHYSVNEKGEAEIDIPELKKVKVESKKKVRRRKRDALKKQGKCPDCGGTGIIGKNICPYCNGNGRWDLDLY